VGVNLAGYLDSALGIGEVARRVRVALSVAGMPVAAHSLTADGVAQVPGAAAPREAARHPVSLVCANADGLEGAHSELGDAWFGGRYVIGYWWWEAGSFPTRWERAFDLLDEVWVGSHQVAGVLAPVAPVPVVRMPVPVTLAPSAGISIGELAQLDGPLFLAVFDHGGVFERKNPLGAVEAFRRAFPSGEPAALVIKSAGADRHPAEHERLLRAVAGDERIALIDRVLSDEEMAALLAACDCYVSLHRAEGFGLPLAEAMMLGKPVVATAYGGPLDYLSERTGYPVDHRLVEIGLGNAPYPADGLWAEPDVDHAAELMRRVVEHPDDAASRGERAREQMQREHSSEAAGETMAARLTRVAGLPAGTDGRPAEASFDELLRRIRSAPAPPARLGPMRALARRAALRLGRPQATHQRQVDEELARALRTLAERVQGLAASNASLLAEVEELRRRLAE
jgi:glycosyltransferase involved in cell wall biosynthesis